MSGKAKFQIARSLENKFKHIVLKENSGDELKVPQEAFITGFSLGNVTNYIGFSTEFQVKYNPYPIVGLAFFREGVPSAQAISNKIDILRKVPGDLIRNSDCEQLETMHFLIYAFDEQSQQVFKKIFLVSTDSYLDELKLSVIDDSKIFANSIICRLSMNVMLDAVKNRTEVKLAETFSDLRKIFSDPSEGIKLHVSNSSFSCSMKEDSNELTETIYGQLDASDEVNQMGDYLPQLSKFEKAKLVEKWRNKMKSQRSPLNIILEHDDLSFEGMPASNYYGLVLEPILHLHANDRLDKSFKRIRSLMLHLIELVFESLISKAGSDLESNEINICTFRPNGVGNYIYSSYAIPREVNPDYANLANIRRQMHGRHLFPFNQPFFRYSQRIQTVYNRNQDEAAGYLCNVHASVLEGSGIKGGSRNVIEGTYTYHHYMQDRINDNGWGCAYRSLQTIISWFKHQGFIYSLDVEANPGKAKEDVTSLAEKLRKESRAPTHEEIQSVLVAVGDKPASFIGSQEWIGSQEVCYVLSHLYGIESKFISISSSTELNYKARELGQHFSSQSTPVMIGGGVLAHTIIGTDFNDNNGDVRYLILDPHYTGPEDQAQITKKGWCGWKKNTFWDKNSFYNLCLPQKPVCY